MRKYQKIRIKCLERIGGGSKGGEAPLNENMSQMRNKIQILDRILLNMEHLFKLFIQLNKPVRLN